MSEFDVDQSLDPSEDEPQESLSGGVPLPTDPGDSDEESPGQSVSGLVQSLDVPAEHAPTYEAMSQALARSGVVDTQDGEIKLGLQRDGANKIAQVIWLPSKAPFARVVRGRDGRYQGLDFL